MSSFGFLAVPCVPAVPRAWACIDASWVWHSIFDKWFHWLVLANWWIHFVTVFLVVKFLMNLTKNNFECFQWSTCSADYFGIFSPLCGCFGRKGGNTPFPYQVPNGAGRCQEPTDQCLGESHISGCHTIPTYQQVKTYTSYETVDVLRKSQAWRSETIILTERYRYRRNMAKSYSTTWCQLNLAMPRDRCASNAYVLS